MTGVVTVEPGESSGAMNGAERDETIQFAIRYSLRDYRRVVFDEIVRKVTAARSDRGTSRWTSRGVPMLFIALAAASIWRIATAGTDGLAIGLVIASVAAALWTVASTTRGLAFIASFIACGFAIAVGKLKPIYQFTVDAAGIRRSSAASDVLVAWSRVIAVHRLSTAWLVELAEGAMPILHRVLSPSMQERLEQLFDAHVPCQSDHADSSPDSIDQIGQPIDPSSMHPKEITP